jgi:SAM-dependent methyltransferase
MKAQISQLLHRTGFMYRADLLRYRLHRIRHQRENKAFKDAHPEFVLPPDYLLYESYGMRYAAYAEGGRQAAEWLIEKASPWLMKDTGGTPGPLSVLDWGCGPARMIRHLPALLPPGSRVFGTDYNAQTIDWCQQNLPKLSFNHNGSEAKLPYANAQFNLVYGISIFTHLNEAQHHAWFGELMRITAPGGLLLFTTQGRAFLPKLSHGERVLFEAGQPVFRGLRHAGHRTCSAFHPPEFLRSLFAPCTCLLHEERQATPGKPLPQDVWLLQKLS